MLEKDRPGKIFIGGLALEIDEEKLETIFGKYGRITEVLIIRDKVHRQSRGFGFVTYENPQDAIDACKGLNETELSGSTLRVTDAVINTDTMAQSPRRGGYSSRGRGGGPTPSPRGYSSRGRGGPPPMRDKSKHPRRSREDNFERRESYDRGGRDRSPVRKAPLISTRGPPPSRDSAYGGRDSGYSRDSGYGEREAGPPRRVSDYGSRGHPPPERSDDRYGSTSQSHYADSHSSYPPPRREYRSPAREPRAGLLDDRLPPSRSYGSSGREPAYSSSARDAPYGASARDSSYPTREYAPPSRSYSPPTRERSLTERPEYGSYPRDERRESYTRSSLGAKEYPSSRSEYATREYGRDAGRDPGAPPPRDSYTTRESYPPRREYGDSREYSSRGGSGGYAREDAVGAPPARESYRDSAPQRSSYDMGSKSSYTSSRGPPPSSRAPPPSSDRYGDDRNGYESRRPVGPPSRGIPSSRGAPSSRSRMDERPPPRAPLMRR